MSKLFEGGGRTRWIWRSAALGLVGAVTAAVFACSDRPTDPTRQVRPQASIPGGATGYDLNNPALSPATVNGAIWIFPSPYKVGTGLIDPFLSVQNAGTEEGFNTDASPLPLNDTRQNFTDALPLNKIPVIKRNGILYREIILDANEADSPPDAFFSIDTFDLFVCLDAAGTTIPTVSTVGGFDGNSNCVKVYNFQSGYTGFATDGLTSGSGKALDYDILIPETAFDAFNVGSITTADCPYNPIASPCGLWVVLHAKMGAYGGDWVTGSTFEEFSTILQPFVTVSKTATPSFTRTYDWQITKSVTPTTITLFDGQSQGAAYTVVVTKDSTDSNWAVSGAVTINNPSDADAILSSVADTLQPGNIQVPLSCGVSFPYTLAAGGTLTCTYNKSFASNPGTTKYVNHVTVELSGLAVSTATSDTIQFTTPTTLANATANETDTNPSQNHSGLTAGATFNYNITFTCNADEGSHKNIATVTGDGGAVLDKDSATVVVNCLTLDVNKGARTALQRTYLWQITKSVTPTTWALFRGDTATSRYTVVAKPQNPAFSDANWMVADTITIHNPEAVSIYLQSVADTISTGLAATVSCGVSFPYTLAAGATLKCTYSRSLPDGSTRTNTATVVAKPTAAGANKAFTGGASVDFSGVTLTEVNKTVHVTDSVRVAGSSIIALGTATYPDSLVSHPQRSFGCDGDAGSHVNTAKITETGDSANATVTVTCYHLDGYKTATTSFKRFWHWSIDKSINEGLLTNYDAATKTATVGENESLVVTYGVSVGATKTDSLWAVSGKIVIKNPHPTMSATLTSVLDSIQAYGNIVPTCPSMTVAAADSIVCTYADGPKNTAVNPYGTPNRARWTQQNNVYLWTGSITPHGTTAYGPVTAAVSFGAPADTIDACVAVADTLYQLGVVTPIADTTLTSGGMLCASSSPYSHTFPAYTRTYGGTTGFELPCNDTTRFPNEATLTTNDTHTQASDTASIAFYKSCVTGCTLTLGYWKTHNESFKGGAPPDTTWDLLAGGLAENTVFFYSGQTWFEVFWTNPKGGNAYYSLAHQYMAAVLNGLAGADASAVTAALADAQALFNTPANTPAYIGSLKGNDALRQQFINLAGILGSYNTGTIGPGHCTEDRTSTLLR